MNRDNVNIIRIKYLLGIIDKSIVEKWAESKIKLDSFDDKISDLYMSKDENKTISLLNELSNSDKISPEDLKKYFYDIFLKMFYEKKNILEIEDYLVSFKDVVSDIVSFDNAEELSYSIINNDLHLRKTVKGNQIDEKDVIEFLKHNTSIK